MSPRPAHPVVSYAATLVRRKPSLDFSITGLVYCSMMMFMGLAAINSQANLLFGVFGLMIGTLLVSGVVSRKVLRRLTVRRVLPDHGVVGRPLTIGYQVTNEKRFWPSLSVTIAELDGAEGFTRQPQGYMLHAASGMTAAVPAEVVPLRRGLHEFDRFQLSTSFPFGFIKRAVSGRHRDRLLVYPALGQVDARVLEMCHSAERTGASMRPQRGGSDEFYGVKEFRPGDNPRRIYWKRSARTAATGTLVARELTQVAPPRLLLLVDTYAADRSPARTARVERAVAMAASLAARRWKRTCPSACSSGRTGGRGSIRPGGSGTARTCSRSWPASPSTPSTAAPSWSPAAAGSSRAARRPSSSRPTTARPGWRTGGIIPCWSSPPARRRARRGSGSRRGWISRRVRRYSPARAGYAPPPGRRSLIQHPATNDL